MGLTQITEKGIKDGEIINADINASAAIAGTKIAPNFGSQDITTTGDVGIGKTPSDRLDVQTTHSSGGRIATFYNSDSGNNGGLIIQGGGSDGEARLQSAGGSSFLTFYTEGGAGNLAERMRIHSSGIVTVGNDPSGAASYGGEMVIATTSGGVLTCADTGSGERLRLEGGSGLGRIGTDSNHALTFITNGTSNERMRIDTSGQIGMGTSSPVQQAGRGLHINGTDQTRIKLTNTSSGATANDGFDIIQENGLDIHLINHESAAMKFGTSATERMRISSGGYLSIGATSYGGGGSTPKLYVSTTSDRAVKIHNTNSATSSLQITNAATGQGDDNGMQLAALSNGECIINNAEAERILIQSQEDDNNKPVVNFIKPQGPSNAQTTMIAFETGNQGRGAVLSSSSDGGSPSFASSSDYRIKTNIRDYTDGYNNIKAIPVKLFDMTSDGTKDIKGWIAHEVQALIPEAVMGVKDAVDSDENPILQQLSYGLFMPDVVGALQTAIAKIEALETKVTALEAA